MSQYYTKINTCFKRSEKTHAIYGEFSSPEIELLRDLKWEATEKIDGTNMSVEIIDGKMEIHGKTPDANIPSKLLKRMHEIFDSQNYKEIFGDAWKIEIFGEGYGAGIQKGGNYISGGVDFICFDIAIIPQEIPGIRYWMKRDSLENICEKMGIKLVPFIGEMTIHEAVEYVMPGFKSAISENKDYQAEGLVLKAPLDLRSRLGNRIMTKIKTCDFQEYERKTGNQWREY